MAQAPSRTLPDDGAMNSLLAAVEAASATTTAPTSTFITTSTPITSVPKSVHRGRCEANMCSQQHPQLAPLHRLEMHMPRSMPVPQPAPSSVPPPPPLPPPLPAPPPLPPVAIRRPSALQNNTLTTASNVVTVHEASPLSSGQSEKRKGARIFSAEEKRILEANYARNKFPSRLHMQTLGRAMGKGTEKIRTWYNNRRALDRKLGIDVSRNSSDHTPLTSPFSVFPSTDPSEEPVILPSHAIASPTTLAANSRASPTDELASSKKQGRLEPTKDGVFVNVTPSTISWAPSVSPVTTERNVEIASCSPTQKQANRFRMSPLRIRNGRLVMGISEICGELTENPAVDRGLEVKFLFGKKRVVYEWYCGDNYAEAQSTGGPYAKMEMSFSNVVDMQLFKSTTSSILQLSFSAAPSLFLQTQESMDKYKVRAQQRQYRKVGVAEFPIPVCANRHRIYMRTDDAVRVSRILIEDTPELASVFQTWQQDCSFAAKPETPSSHLVTLVSERTELKSTDARLVGLSMSKGCEKSPGDSHLKSMSIAELSRRSRQSDVPYMGIEDMSPPVHSSRKDHKHAMDGGDELPIVRPTTAAGAATNLLASPAPWHSPATPFVSSALPKREETVHWLTGGVPPSVSATPFAERTNVHDTARDATKVRRELNFNSVNQFPTEPATPTSYGRKRNASEAALDENDPRRRKLAVVPASKNPIQASRCGLPELPFPPNLSPQFRGEASDMEKGMSGEAHPQAAEQPDSVLRALPR